MEREGKEEMMNETDFSGVQTKGDKYFMVQMWIPLLFCKWKDGRVVGVIHLPMSTKKVCVFGMS